MAVPHTCPRLGGESPFSGLDSLNTGHRYYARPGGLFFHWPFVIFCFVSLSTSQDPLAIDGKFNLLFSLTLVNLSFTGKEGGRSGIRDWSKCTFSLVVHFFSR